MPRNLLQLQFNRLSPRLRLTLALACCLLVVAPVLFFGTRQGKAATPTSGTVTQANTPANPLVYTAGPFNIANPSGVAALRCAPAQTFPCDDYALDVNVPDGLTDTNHIRISVQWPNAAADFDIYAYFRNPNGTPGGLATSSGSSSDPEVMILPAVSQKYLIRVVPFNPLGQSITTNITFEPKNQNFNPATGPAPGYQNYAAPNGLGTSSGEPSIGVNWLTGNVLFQAGLETLRVKFSDAQTPATATWEDKSSTFTSLTSLDPILFTDSRTGRTVVSQLTGQDSLSAYTDDDGELWIPSQGGGIPSGVDHQSVGGGPFAPPLTGGTAAYPNAVYYCSQDLYTAFCARSDDGGLTFGPGVPTYTTECTGIHGHVKVAPDGTVYLPNRQCGTNQGVAVSENNGITWTVRKVVDNDPTTTAGDSIPGSWDPSVGIGSNGTVYFGYENGDGRPRMAVSRDKGHTWVRDQNVGRDLNIRDTAFPAVVAGDDDRAAFAFLGSQVSSGDNTAVWHLYISTTYDRGNTWLTVDATPTDPVQLGTICSNGLACSGGDRNLLDFMDATVDKEGRTLVGYADGCLAGCTAPAASRAELATIARQQCGRRLFHQFDPTTDDCASTNPTPTPTPTPSLTNSCDGVNVVTDATDDGVNPAPGGQGPTDQADITSVSFEKVGTNIVTKITIKNLSAVPAPGTTFTSYYVAWKGPNGTVYASEADVDASGLVFYGYGPFDGVNQLSTYNSTTGTYTPGANGTITVNVPISGVGNPTIPVTDVNAIPAARDTYAVTIAGQGVLGAGLIYNAPIDRAPNSGFGANWAVCPTQATPTPTPTPTATPTPTPTATPTPSPTPTNDARCLAPGVTVVTDPANDQTGAPNANQSQDIRSIAIAEQYATGGSGQITVTMAVSALDPATLPPNATWRTSFNATHADGSVTTYFVTVANNSSANPSGLSFNYGFVDTTGASTISRTVGTADAGSINAAAKTLSVTLALNKLKKPVAGTGGGTLSGPVVDLSAGKLLANVNGTTSILVGAVGNGLNQTLDSTGSGNYTMAGAVVCPPPAPTPTPTPVGSSGAPRYQNFVAPAGVAESAGEPSIGVNWRSERTFSNSSGAVPNGGTVHYFGGFLPYMLRVTFDDSVSPANATWDQAPVTLPNAPRVFGDPILFTDRQTGRVFVSQELGLTPLGSTMEFSDDDGRSFRPSEGSGVPSGVDHQTVGGGPYHAPVPNNTNPVYANAVYYCSQVLAGATCSLSVDGGMSFGPGVPIYTLNDCGGIHGHVKVAPDGTVYVPNRSCNGQQGLAVSQDNGITWRVWRVPGSSAGDTDPSVGIANDGSVYFGYEDGSGHARIAVSRNSGQTWSSSVDVGASQGLQNIVFPAVVAGDSNRAAFAFHGTTTAGSYNDEAFPGVWYLYIATTLDGGQTWTTVNATPGDPVQRGKICTDGINCSSTGVNTRNLLDFFDATVDKQGRVVVGYVDGCIGPCVQGGPNSGTAKAVIARQSGGPRLFDLPGAPGASSVPGTPSVSGSVSGGTATLAWATPDNGGAPITGYRIVRRDGGTLTSLGTVTSTNFIDGAYNSVAQSVYRVTAINANGESAYREYNPAGATSASPCAQPGVQVVSDTTNDGTDLDSGQNTPPDGRVNIKSLSIAEPYLGPGTNKLIFTLKVAPSTLVGAPPSSQWYIVWNRRNPDADFDRWYVAMKSDAAGNLTYEYGKFGVALALPPAIANPNANTPMRIGAADGGSYDVATGTITITLSNSKAENIGAGYQMTGVNARTYLAKPDSGIRSQNISSDFTGDGTYTLVGNASCAVAQAAPLSLPDETPAWRGLRAALLPTLRLLFA